MRKLVGRQFLPQKLQDQSLSFELIRPFAYPQSCHSLFNTFLLSLLSFGIKLTLSPKIYKAMLHLASAQLSGLSSYPQIPSILDSFPQNTLVLYTARLADGGHTQGSSRQGFPDSLHLSLESFFALQAHGTQRLAAIIIAIITALGELLSVCGSSQTPGTQSVLSTTIPQAVSCLAQS